jgi:murein DD-endopeptidase MepM/ murein hydrolase activator NlpD
MSLRILRRLGAAALALSAVVAVALPAGGSPAGAASADELVAPFSCGTQWQGTTYHGHGSNDWNLDLNRFGADGTDLGQPLLAQADGTVVWFEQSGYNNHAGTYVEIDYGAVTVRYIHLVEHSIPEGLAVIGAPVERGELIGRLGDTGRVTGPHLHLEYWDSADFDDTAWYQLPRENHIPVAFEGQTLIAEPGRPAPVIESTNCPPPTRDEIVSVERLARYDALAEEG